MSGTNPYQAPTAAVRDMGATESNEKIERVRSGQKLVLYAILAQFAAIGMATVTPFAAFVQFGAALASIYGMVRIVGGLGWGVGRKILLVILCFIPLISLLVLLSVNARATKALRESGYQVGLMGASARA